MTYDEVCESVLEAMDKMDKCGVVPHYIYFSPQAFNAVAKGNSNRPMFMGLEVRIGNFPFEQQFVISQGEME